MKYKAIYGTHDILPDDLPKWEYVENKIRQVMCLYNYSEIRTPIFEQTDLFIRSIGEETDIVKKEMYTFLDMGKRSMTLRPEGTAPIVRSYLEHNLGEKASLVKLFYIGPMFRQERPQKGRLRQFHQYGAEAIGSLDPLIDVEIINLNLEIFRNLNLENHQLHLNSIGCPACRPIHIENLINYAKSRKNKLCPECQIRLERNPLRMFDCKNEDCIQELKDAPVMLDFLCDDCKKHFKQVVEYLDHLKIKYLINKRLVRGLDYYTRTAFEFKSSLLGTQDTISGGGRYDLLVSDFGGKDTPAIGFAAGVERLILCLEKEGKLNPKQNELDVFVAILGEKVKQTGLKLVQELRSNGLKCDMDFLNRSLKAQMREANRQNAKKVVIIGEDEIKRNIGIVKDMERGGQEEVGLDKIKELLNGR
jgi:histidyl-tRNA synthetase